MNILLLFFTFLLSAESALAGKPILNKCANIFSRQSSEYSQELHDQLKWGEPEVQKNALDLLRNYGIDNKAIHSSLLYILNQDSSEQIRLAAFRILKSYRNKTKNPDTIKRIFSILRKSLKESPSTELRIQIIDYFGYFIFHEGVRRDLIHLLWKDASLIGKKAFESLQRILNFHFDKWHDTFTALKNPSHQRVVEIDRKYPEEVQQVIKMAYFYADLSKEVETFKPLLNILRNRRHWSHLKPFVLAEELSVLKKHYSREARTRALDLLIQIYRTNVLKIKIVHLLEENPSWKRMFKVLMSHKDFESIYNDMKENHEEISMVNKMKSDAKSMNQKILFSIIDFVRNEPEINNSLIRKGLDFLLEVFKEDKDANRDAAFEFLHRVSTDPNQMPLIRQKAKKAFENLFRSV